ncbi:MAG: LicD family protein, partial [Lachnospiraceae bacterium]|nr:LicD family protein [Lachnospiraceae bacterium]
DKTLDHLEELLRKNDFDNSSFAGNMLGRYREREVVPTEYFGTAVEGVFENMQVKIPAKTHQLLTALYGNYMELPPENERVAHNVNLLKCREI